MMAESGRFGAGYTLAELRKALDLKVTAPSPEVQDPQKDEAVYDAQQKAGVLSAKTRAGLSGLDYEQEVANGAKAADPAPMYPGQPMPTLESTRLQSLRFSLLEGDNA
jgi:hypothetical protein